MSRNLLMAGLFLANAPGLFAQDTAQPLKAWGYGPDHKYVIITPTDTLIVLEAPAKPADGDRLGQFTASYPLNGGEETINVALEGKNYFWNPRTCPMQSEVTQAVFRRCDEDTFKATNWRAAPRP